jgi:hypothetical protein
MRTPYGVSSLATVAAAMVWSLSSLITPSLICRRQGGDHQQPHGAFQPGNPYRADVAHSFIVTVMKPVVHVPRYQVLPRILSGGAVP